jgi:hypothetical protein
MKKRTVRKRQRQAQHSRGLLNRHLTQQSELARNRALHVLAAMRRDPYLSLSRAAKLEGVKPETVKRHFSSSLRKSAGKFTATKSDRHVATLYLPDAHGSPIPIPTRSAKERKQASNYLRDLGRYLRGQKNALAKWHGKKIAGVELVTAGRTVVALEPALFDFHIYRVLNGGAA